MKDAWIKRNNSGFLSLLSLVFTLAIICIISYLAVKVYFKKPLADKGTEGFVSAPVVVTPANYKAVMSDTINQVEDINKKRFDGLDQLEDSK